MSLVIDLLDYAYILLALRISMVVNFERSLRPKEVWVGTVMILGRYLLSVEGCTNHLFHAPLFYAFPFIVNVLVSLWFAFSCMSSEYGIFVLQAVEAVVVIGVAHLTFLGSLRKYLWCSIWTLWLSLLVCMKSFRHIALCILGVGQVWSATQDFMSHVVVALGCAVTLLLLISLSSVQMISVLLKHCLWLSIGSMLLLLHNLHGCSFN